MMLSEPPRSVLPTRRSACVSHTRDTQHSSPSPHGSGNGGGGGGAVTADSVTPLYIHLQRPQSAAVSSISSTQIEKEMLHEIGALQRRDDSATMFEGGTTHDTQQPTRQQSAAAAVTPRSPTHVASPLRPFPLRQAHHNDHHHYHHHHGKINDTAAFGGSPSNRSGARIVGGLPEPRLPLLSSHASPKSRKMSVAPTSSSPDQQQQQQQRLALRDDISPWSHNTSLERPDEVDNTTAGNNNSGGVCDEDDERDTTTATKEVNRSTTRANDISNQRREGQQGTCRLLAGAVPQQQQQHKRFALTSSGVVGETRKLTQMTTSSTRTTATMATTTTSSSTSEHLKGDAARIGSEIQSGQQGSCSSRPKGSAKRVLTTTTTTTMTTKTSVIVDASSSSSNVVIAAHPDAVGPHRLPTAITSSPFRTALEQGGGGDERHSSTLSGLNDVSPIDKWRYHPTVRKAPTDSGWARTTRKPTPSLQRVVTPRQQVHHAGADDDASSRQHARLRRITEVPLWTGLPLQTTDGEQQRRDITPHHHMKKRGSSDRLHLHDPAASSFFSDDGQAVAAAIDTTTNATSQKRKSAMVPVRSMKTGHIVVGYISRNPDSATTPTSEDYLDDITTDEKKIGMIVAPISFSAMRSQKLLSPSALRASSAGSSATSPRTTTNISPPWEQQQQQHHQQQRRVSFSSDRDGNGEQSGSTRLTGLGEQRQRQQRRASPDGSSSSPPTSITMRANSNDPSYDANIISEDLLQPRRRLSSPSSPLQEPARRSSPSPVVDREGRGGASADVRRPPSPSDRPHHCLERTHPHTDAPPPIAAVSTGGNSGCPNSATQTNAALHLDVVENNVRSSSPQTVLRSSAGASPSAAAALLNCEAAIDVTSPSPSSSALLDTEVPLLPTEQIPSRCGSTTAHEKEEAPPPSTTHGSAMGNAEEERAVEEVAGANVPDVVPDGAALVATPTRRGAPLMQMDDASSPLPHPFPNDSAPQPHPAVVVVAVDSTKFQDDEGGEQQGILQQVEQSRGTSSAPPTSCETSMREKETNVFLERGSAAAAALPPPTPPATTQVDNNTAPPPEANREEGDGRGELTLTDEDDDTTTTIRVAQNDHHNDDDASANPSSSVSSSAVVAPTARGKCATRKKQKGGKGSR